ncbi:MAG TPA: hypothetical protein VIK51_13860 [Vicinamibacteria bacterium]|jgi:hypothetical protein
MRRGPHVLHVAILVAVVGLACAAATAVSPTETAGESVLFIGNSLTAANDLPARVAEIATAAGYPLRTSAVTAPGASLLDHWEDGRAVRAIRDGRWSVVVLQQGPSTLPESRAELIASTRQFAAEIRRAGARPALLMVWPLPGQQATAVSASHRAAAEANDALLLPAGDAWTIVGARDSSMILVGPDGFHPSVLGTYAAALTVACALLPPDRPSLARAVSASGLRLDVARRDLLVDAACSAVTARH